MPRPRVDVLVHLRLSDDAAGAAAERDALFRLDEAIDNRFGDEYDGNDVGEGVFRIRGQQVQLDLKPGASDEPGGSRSRTAIMLCPLVSPRFLRCPPVLELPLPCVLLCPPVSSRFRECVIRL